RARVAVGRSEAGPAAAGAARPAPGEPELRIVPRSLRFAGYRLRGVRPGRRAAFAGPGRTPRRDARGVPGRYAGRRTRGSERLHPRPPPERISGQPEPQAALLWPGAVAPVVRRTGDRAHADPAGCEFLSLHCPGGDDPAEPAVREQARRGAHENGKVRTM